MTQRKTGNLFIRRTLPQQYSRDHQYTPAPQYRSGPVQSSQLPHLVSSTIDPGHLPVAAPVAAHHLPGPPLQGDLQPSAGGAGGRQAPEGRVLH